MNEHEYERIQAQADAIDIQQCVYLFRIVKMEGGLQSKSTI